MKKRTSHLEQDTQALINRMATLIRSEVFLSGQHPPTLHEQVVTDPQLAQLLATQQDFEFLNDERCQGFYAWTEILEDMSHLTLPGKARHPQFRKPLYQRQCEQFNADVAMPLLHHIGPQRGLAPALVGPLEALMDVIFSYYAHAGLLLPMHVWWLQVLESGGAPVGWQGAYVYPPKGWLKSGTLPLGKLAVYLHGPSTAST